MVVLFIYFFFFLTQNPSGLLCYKHDVFNTDFKNNLKDIDELISVRDYVSLNLISQSYFLVSMKNFIVLFIF